MDRERERDGAGAEGEEVRLTEVAREDLERFRRAHETKVLTIFFSDLVDSTRLQRDLGNIHAAALVRDHYDALRRVLSSYDGREIKTAGDSMLIAFASPSEAVRFAVEAQRAARRAREGAPEMPPFRAGIHQGQVILEREEAEGGIQDIYGVQVSTAARIMDLARGGQVLCSRAVFDDARAILRQVDFKGCGSVAWRNHGPYRFKGVDEAHEVCEVGEEGFAPLLPPPAAAKGWPADRASEELGWRPAAGVVVPDSNWRLEKKLGEGEFGEVWKAQNSSDRSYQVFKFCFKRDRLPALKREARLLKRLRRYAHPSLVEVFDVTEGERPPHYLEMEYVEGPPLRDWLAGNPPLADRLEVIAQVADALDTVHAAGIYHRDIKPSNILVGRREDGALQAKLTDFGLGAAEDADLLKSICASRVEGVAGTWDYIAPEIRQGKKASPQSDIYGLGLSLYQLVTGDVDRPLTADWESQVPSEVLREDIRRCVSQSPGDRWPRAADLARALRSHDQRLRERRLERDREEHRRRARRLRRVSAVVSLVALLTVALGGIALYGWKEAARQRDRAVAQKRLALEAIDKLTHDVPLRLRDVPGTLPALRKILEENIEMLDRILALEPDTPRARRERGVNLLSVGDRWMLLGDAGRALDAYEAGLRISGELAAANPGEAGYRRDLSNAYDRMGGVRLALGRTAEALEAYEKAQEIARELVAKDPGSRGARRDLCVGLDRLGGIYQKLGRTEDALKAYEDAMAIAGKLASEAPGDLQAQRDLSLSHERLGDIDLVLGRTTAALEAYETSMAMGKRFAEARPESAEARRDLSVGHDKLGKVYLRLGKTEEALKAFGDSLAVARALASEDPENVQLQRDLFICHDRLGDVYQRLERTEDALASFEAAAAISRKVAEKDAGSASAQYDLSAALSKLGNVRLRAGKAEEAFASYSGSLDIFRRLAAADPSDVEVQRSLSVLLNKVGGAQLGLGRALEAERSFEESIQVAGRLAALDPKSLEAQRDLGVSCFRAMGACQAAKTIAKWREVSRKAVGQFQLVLDASKDDPQARNDLIGVLSAATSGLSSFPDAEPGDLEAALGQARRLVELSGGSDPAHLDTLALCQSLTGDAAAAAATAEKALAALPQGPAGDGRRKELAEKLEKYRAAAKAPRKETGPPKGQER